MDADRLTRVLLFMCAALILFVLLMPYACSAQKMKPRNQWALDSRVTLKLVGRTDITYPDKMLHFGRDYLLTETLHSLGMVDRDWLVVAAFNFLYEVKDSVVPYDDKGNVEGFDPIDFAAGMAGIGYAKWKQRWSPKWRWIVLPVEIGLVFALVETQ